MKKNPIFLISVITIVAFFIISIFIVMSQRVSPIQVTCYGSQGTVSSENKCITTKNFEIELENKTSDTVNVFIYRAGTAGSWSKIGPAFISDGVPFSELGPGDREELNSTFESTNFLVVEVFNDGVDEQEIEVSLTNALMGRAKHNITSSIIQVGYQIIGVHNNGRGDESHIIGHICKPSEVC